MKKMGVVIRYTKKIKNLRLLQQFLLSMAFIMVTFISSYMYIIKLFYSKG